jgi:hypothetical protein
MKPQIVIIAETDNQKMPARPFSITALSQLLGLILHRLR